MNGSQGLIRTLAGGGVNVCFTNPGTSEMHFVAALDAVPEMRGVLTLFEGVATGAADGYARIAGRPGTTLLHLGPGLGNGLANLHNARRAKVPVLNIVGDHATSHVRYDAQLQSDIETVARNVSPGWVRTSRSTQNLSADAIQAINAALGPPGQVATLILPADVSWGEGGSVEAFAPQDAPASAAADVIAEIGRLICGARSPALLLGGRALREPGLRAAARVAAATGAKLFCETFPTRLERGGDLPELERLAYLAELSSVQLSGLDLLVLVDAQAPVSFFAYPGRQGDLVPDGCEVRALAEPSQDVLTSLQGLAEEVAGGVGPAGRERDGEGASARADAAARPARPEPPSGALTADAVCQAIGALLPDGAIISDESNTSGVTLASHTAGAGRHDLLALTGGAIGQGLPVAVGAAIAAPGRPVIALEADGSAMYTIQSLWTMAREELDVTVVILNNRSYAILNIELQRVGGEASGPRSRSQLDLSGPDLDFVALATGMGVPAVRVQTGEELTAELKRALAEPGPHLIEALVPSVYSGMRLRAMPYALRALEALPRPVAQAVKRRIYP